MNQVISNKVNGNEIFTNVNFDFNIARKLKKEDQVLNDLKNIANKDNSICLIVDIENFKFVHINPTALEYFKLKNEELCNLNINDIFKLLHPYNHHIIKNHICDFKLGNMESERPFVYYLETNKGGQWIHSVTTVASFTPNGNPKYLFLSGTNITDILDGTGKFRKVKKDLAFIKDNMDKFKLLTKREKEILSYIVQEKTSIEIGITMHLSSKTVDTHRNNVIAKLHLNSSVCLVKYAVEFDLV